MAGHNARPLALLLIAIAACGSPDGSVGSASSSSASPAQPTSSSPLASASVALARSAARESVEINIHARGLRALRKGRGLAEEGSWKEAQKEFESAVEADPENPIPYSELGWAAFNAGDLERASSATDQGLAFATEPKPRASLLYNRGRIAEAKGDKDAAKKSYEDSLALRDSATVRKRLAGLGGAGASQPAPKKKAVCERTFATVKEACDCLTSERATLGLPEQGDATCLRLDVETALSSRPIELVRIVVGSEAVVWVLADVRGRLQPVAEVEGGDIAPKKLLAPIDGDATVVSLLADRTSTETGKAVRTTFELFCLVGAHPRAPRCPLEVPHAVAELEGKKPKPDRTVTLSRTIRGDKVKIKKQAGPDDLVPPDAIGEKSL